MLPGLVAFGDCSFHSPPDKTAYYYLVQTVTCTLILNSESVVIFSFFRFAGCASQRDKRQPKSHSIMPGQTAICQVRPTTGQGKRPEFSTYLSIRPLSLRPTQFHKPAALVPGKIQLNILLPAPELKIQTVPQMKLRQLSRL